MTVSIMQLWMPILLGGVLAWFASGLIHMVIKYHNADYKQLPNEDEISAAVRSGSPGVGFYSAPYCADMKDMGSEEMQNKFVKGPVMFLTVMPSGMPPMGKLLGQQIAFFLVSCVLIAYCTTLALAPGQDYMTVFRVVSSIAFLTFGWAIIPFSIWYGHPWSTTARYMLDALIYALIVAGCFSWLWPAAVSLT